MDFKDKIADLLSKELSMPKEQVLPLLTVPPQGMGDYAFPCFIAAKEQKKSPLEVSKALAGRVSSDFLEKVEAKGPYLNFFLSKKELSSSSLEGIFTGSALKTSLGKGRVMVEYSGPNTNKPLHVGHLRNNSLGLAIANLLQAAGFKVIKANIVNDRGVHICKSMLAYKLFAAGRDPAKEGIKTDHFVGDMYVLFAQKAKEDPSLEEKAQELLRLWEKNDKETVALWKKMNKWALDGMKQTYTTFGSKFDEWFFESGTFKKQSWKKIIEEGLKKGVFKREDNGAVVAILEPGLPNKVLLRGDGTSLYITNDLGLTEEKFGKFKLDKSIWVVGNEQELYFRQLFVVFEKLGRAWAKQCYHLSYGMVSLPSGRLKSREGVIADADELIWEMKKLAIDELDRRYPGLDQKVKAARALAIALAAIKFYLLKNDARKDMVFDPEKSISFEGETGPYLQYTYARACSILRKAGKEEKINLKKTKGADFGLLSNEKEKELIIALGSYADAVKKSWELLSLHPLCHALLKISEKFNSFYHEVPVLKAKTEKEKLARLALVQATILVLEKGLGILDIEAIKEM